MVEVTLQEYCEEVEGLIDQGAFDAAISHCQHILKIHPKYLKAYSLIGKTALENGDLEAAADLFSRVLSIDPEDFVARVGLSIASDKEGSLDQAVWHMERAFELAPDNQAIVAELRQLYGRRDGMEPEKVKLTQGALARLHARGHLYTQAINELRRLLEVQPDRVDLQVALAETLWQADRRIEAAETSLAILEKLPYCLKANLILGEIWSSSGREAEGMAHLERAQMIDPENRVARDLFGARAPLPPVDVHIGRMEYVAPPAPAEQEPDWLAALVEEGTSPAVTDEAVPDWLQAVAASAAIAAASPEEKDTSDTEPVPDWLQDVAATADMEAEEFALAPGTPAPIESEMPDWLAALTAEPEASTADILTPEETTGWLDEGLTPAAEEPVPGPDELADWLGAMEAGEAEPAEIESLAAEEPEMAPAEMPDWLAEMTALEGAQAEAEPGEAEFPIAEEAELAPDEIPDWLAEVAPTEGELPEAEEAELAASEMPGWLAEMAPTEAELPEGEEAEFVPGEMPGWLAETAEAGLPAPDEAQLEPGELPDWLAELATIEEEPIKAEDLGLAPAEIPDWLAEMAPADTEPLEAGYSAVSELDVTPAEVPDWLAEEVPPEAGPLREELVEEELETAPSAPAAADTPDWLSELVEAAGVTMEEEETPADVLTESEEETIPEWLAELGVAETPAIEESLAPIEIEEPEALGEEVLAALEEEAVTDAEAELMARVEEMSPEEAFAAWEAMLAESEVEEAAPTAEEALISPEEEGEAIAEAELMARIEEMSPEEAFAAWEAMLAEGELEEAVPAEEVELLETAAAGGPIVIEEPEKETLVYPEGAGGEVTDAEAELMARMEEMSPEEAFAAWEAMLAESEVEEAAPTAEEALISPEEEGEAIAEAELMARIEEMSPEEAFAAWEAMLAEGEEYVPKEEVPSTAKITEAEDVWMALVEDEDAEVVAELDKIEMALVEEEPLAQPVTDLDQAWMTLDEDEGLEEIAEPSVLEEAPIVAEIEAVERPEEPEIELPAWATYEAVEAVQEAPQDVEQEITLGPDLVLLTEEEEFEIMLPQEPEAAVPVDVAKPRPEVAEPADEEVTFAAVAEALPTEAEPPEQPPWVALEEEPVAEAPIEEAPAEEEKVAEAIAEALTEEAPGMEEKVAEPKDDQARLELARQLWATERKEEAHSEYERLLRSPLRGDVTVDLERLASDESADESTLRLLGDAYMKDDRLQEALAAYRRALALL